ncbi:ganglioside-induced differentiation-associated protein 1-like [Saccostrea echinata]|uniref:ganglioside-induced differentiation-associated protein 1-like n=1 Tax=Saccostrea echinata TaxID=191078 RepID=UPI002A811D36|nr:ganglioside-induced differentiation-associated protein 1-like [Saccostrea echinata]
MTMSDLTLYYFPGSYYSQRALLALYEKDAKFKHQVVFIHDGDNITPSYMRMNPAGQVPVLADGRKIITESDAIIKYVDENVHTGSTLIPDETSSVGKEVTRLWKLINSVRVEIMTFGVLSFQDLSTTGLHPIAKPMANMDQGKRYEGLKKTLAALAEKYPDLRDAYNTKIEFSTNFPKNFQNRELVVKVLNDVEKTLDEIENVLKKVKEEQGISDCWLVGPRFTAADIALATLLDRISFLGLAARYFTQEKRPHLYQYYQRLGTRKSVQQVRSLVLATPRMFILRKLKKASPFVVGIIAAGIGVAVAYSILKRK